MRGWGFWSREIAEAFDSTVSQVCRTSPHRAPLLMDLTELKPLREEGQQSFGALVGLLRVLGVGRTVIATSSQLTKLQLLRLASEQGMKDVVEFMDIDKDCAPDLVMNAMQKVGVEA